jgi:hypothetical protein
MRRAAQQHFTLLQSLAHQAEFVILEIAQTAVNQLGGGRGSVRRKVVAFAQHHLEAAPGQIACNARPVDAATDDQHVAGDTGRGRRNNGAVHDDMVGGAASKRELQAAMRVPVARNRNDPARRDSSNQN